MVVEVSPQVSAAPAKTTNITRALPTTLHRTLLHCCVIFGAALLFTKVDLTKLLSSSMNYVLLP